jgi:glucose/arabinose dehydrogenase/cytochrome c551/c552
LRYSDKTKDVKQVGFLNVYYQTNTKGVNAEEGVLGMTLDPNFKTNNFVYIFYSPIDTSVNRLSRFEYKNDTIDLRTEKVVLELYSQREICCHTGGSLAFGADNTLFLSTGDNSTPFDEPNQQYVNRGFAPLNDAPGHEQYDARRTSGNTNDLRGKVLRIKINADGSYSIPPGNLFQNDPKARPEIYVMGNRNPYRISIDKKTGFLYWGEVGPDSYVDSFATRGSRGYDEVNQARKAGFFGWPLFVGNNYNYREFDYQTGKVGEAFDVARPINRSRNNTGLEQLPPAQPAFIYYPYGPSKDFPQVGTGGRNAMAGPVYYVDDYPKATRYPDYFNGKLFIYEWIRDWMKVVTMLPNGDFDKMDPFMEHTKNKAAIDMEVGPDGRIYILEYGKGWFSKNPDAGISRIDYMSGNRPPKVDSLVVDKESGTLPLAISAKISASDPENDEMTYVWKVGDKTVETKEPSLRYTLQQAGEYVVSVEVRDDEKASSKSTEVTVVAGNEQPQVDISVQGNKSFYFPGKPIQYSVNVVDRGDSVNRSNVFIGTDFLQGNEDLAAQGHQIVPPDVMGKNIMMSSDCKSCHKINEKSIGPSFTEVAQRRKDELRPNIYITEVILKGSRGKWGENVMPAHPTMKEGDAKLIAQFILSLAGDKAQRKSLPPSGTVMPKPDVKQKQNTYFAINASYTDLGSNGVRPLTGATQVILRSNVIDVGQIKTMEGFASKDSSGNKYLVFPAQNGFLRMNKVDLTGIKSLVLSGGSNGANAGYTIEIRTNGVTGNVIGQGKLTVSNNKPISLAIPVQQAGSGDLQDVFIVVRADGPVTGNVLLKTIRFNP